MDRGRRWAVRAAATSATALLLVEALELVVWPLPFGSLYVLAVLASIAVPMVGAWLVVRRDERGIAVLVFGALIALAPLAYGLVRLVWWTEPITAMELLLASLRVLAPGALVVAGAAAWRGRYREAWHGHPPAAWVYGVVAAATFAMGQVWPTRHMLPPATVFDVPFLIQVLTLGAALVAIAWLPRRLAGAALLATVAPVLATAMFDLGQAMTFGASLQGASGIVDLLGRIVLVIIGAVWVRDHRPRSVPAAEPT